MERLYCNSEDQEIWKFLGIWGPILNPYHEDLIVLGSMVVCLGLETPICC